MLALIQTETDPFRLPALFIIGLAIFFGTAGARLFQRFRIPQVVGYIIIGLIVGQSGLDFIDAPTVRDLEPFSFFALGIIGFLIGGELHWDVFKKHGRQFFSVLLAEGVGAFVVVTCLTGLVALLLGLDPTLALALSLVLGAIASATAPAATVNVLWENKAAGPLTRAVFAVVALDDALALLLYSVASSFAMRLMGEASGGIMASIGHVGWELGGGVILGIMIGIVLNFVLRHGGDHDNALAYIIGAVAVTAGSARLLEVDMILASMTLGGTIANLAPRRSKQAFETVERFTAPIFALFFVTVGAQLDLQGMPFWMWALAIPYVAGRTVGKYAGARIGATLSKAPQPVQRYLGMCLFSQAGVAVGLSITASQRFEGEIGVAILSIIALTTFIVQLVGPPCVKIAIQKAGEAGLNVTEDDLMEARRVSDMTDRGAPRFSEGTSLAQILRTIAYTQSTVYPVTNDSDEIVGVITFEGLKESLGTEGLTQWLVAYDLMEDVPDTVKENEPLADAVGSMREQNLDYLPVISASENQLVGMLELRVVSRKLSEEVLRRHKQADDA